MRRGWRTFSPETLQVWGKWFYDSDNPECQRSLKATDTHPNSGFWRRLRIPSKLIRGTCFPVANVKVKEFCLLVFSHLIAHPRTTSPGIRFMGHWRNFWSCLFGWAPTHMFLDLWALSWISNRFLLFTTPANHYFWTSCSMCLECFVFTLLS